MTPVEVLAYGDCEQCRDVLDAFERDIAQALEPYLGSATDESTRAAARQPLRDLLEHCEAVGIDVAGDWPDLRVHPHRVGAHVH